MSFLTSLHTHTFDGLGYDPENVRCKKMFGKRLFTFFWLKREINTFEAGMFPTEGFYFILFCFILFYFIFIFSRKKIIFHFI